ARLTHRGLPGHRLRRTRPGAGAPERAPVSRRPSLGERSVGRLDLPAGAGGEIFGEDVVHGGERLHEVQLAANVGRPRQAFHVPAEVLAELDGRAARIVLVRLRHARVFGGDGETL